MGEDLLKRVSAALETSMHHGMLVIDRDFKIAFINDALCNVWRVRRQEVMHRSLLTAFYEGQKKNRSGAYVGPLIESMDQGKPILGREVYLRFALSGRGSWFQVSTFLLKDKAGVPEYAVGSYVPINRFKRMENELKEVNYSILKAFVKAINARDQYTSMHSDNVSGLMGGFAEYLQLSSEEVNKAYIAGLIHDVGKIAVNEAVLNKPGKLSDSEYEEIKRHSVKGAEILQEVAEFEELAHIVRHHHERYDGKGYPDGIAGLSIPFHSRMLALCDSYDAMVSVRCYSSSCSTGQALQEIMRYSGMQFDPELADKFTSFVKLAGLAAAADDETA